MLHCQVTSQNYNQHLGYICYFEQDQIEKRECCVPCKPLSTFLKHVHLIFTIRLNHVIEFLEWCAPLCVDLPFISLGVQKPYIDHGFWIGCHQYFNWFKMIWKFAIVDVDVLIEAMKDYYNDKVEMSIDVERTTQMELMGTWVRHIYDAYKTKYINIIFLTSIVC